MTFETLEGAFWRDLMGYDETTGDQKRRVAI